MKSRETNVTELCEELGVSRTTLYAHVTPQGELTERGQALMKVKAKGRASVVSQANNTA